MAGGLASISGTVIGVVIISLLQQGILALGFTKEYQYIITGLIVIAAVYADVSARRRKISGDTEKGEVRKWAILF